MKLGTLVKRIVILSCVFSGAALTLTACSSEDIENEHSGYVRFVHANPEISTLDVMLDEDSDNTLQLSYGEVTEYEKFDEGSVSMRVSKAGSPVPMITSDIKIEGEEYSTVFITGTAKESDYEQKDDSKTEPADGLAKVRFAALYDISDIVEDDYDLYVLAPGANINLVNPDIEGISYQQVSSYFELDAGVARVVLTASETKDVVYDSGYIDIEEEKIYTFMLMENTGGGLPLEGELVEDSTK